MSDSFGTGIFLDGQLDFSVDSTGDLKNKSGVAELQKDLAMQMIFNLSQYLGRGPSGNIKEKVAGTAKRIAEADARVDFVDTRKTEVSFGPNREELTLKMTVQTVDGEQNLVFDV